MQLKIKKEYLGKIVINTRRKLVLTADLSQNELNYIKNHINSEFVEGVKTKTSTNKSTDTLERVKKEVKSYSKNKVNDKSNKKPE